MGETYEAAGVSIGAGEAAVEAIKAEDVVMEIASNVSVIFVPAYDDDGLLLWSRTRLDARDFVDTSATGFDGL